MPIDVELGGVTYTATRPKDAVMFFAASVSSEWAGTEDQAFAVLQFLRGVFTPADFDKIFKRLMARDEPDFDLDEDLVSRIQEMIEYWDGMSGNRQTRRATTRGTATKSARKKPTAAKR